MASETPGTDTRETGAPPDPRTPGEEPTPEPGGEPAPEQPGEEAAGNGEPPDPAGSEQRWAAFAPAPERRPGRWRRATAATGRGLVHEWTLATVGALALAVAMTWPALRYPQYTLPQDLGDPALVTWLLSWSGHALTTDPGQLWHANAFFPERWTFAFTDTLLGYAPAGLLGSGVMDAVLRYNILYVLSYALAFLGAYALVRQLGADRIAALVAGLAFAYAPWRLAQAGHLHILSTGGIALALAMLARGHGWSLRYGFRRRRVRVGWIIAGWLMAAWQITIGFGVGLVFGYVLLGLTLAVVLGWLARRVPGGLRRLIGGRSQGADPGPVLAVVPEPGTGPTAGPVPAVAAVAAPAATDPVTVPVTTEPASGPPATGRRRARAPIGRLATANLVGGTVFAAATVLMALPYLLVSDRHPNAQRSFDEVALFSPPPRGLVTAPPESWLWGARHADARVPEILVWPPEMTLLPGFALLGLALAGLVFSVWSVRVRVLLAAGVVASTLLALGTEFADGAAYRFLYDWLPGWDALRTPGRLIIWTTLLLGVLAAGAVSALLARAKDLALSRGSPRPGLWLKLAALVPAVLVLVEGIGNTPYQVVPQPPAALAQVDGPVLVLPSDPGTDSLVMLWTTDRFVPVVNGVSGFVPGSQHETRLATAAFPDPASIAHLRTIGVATVVVLPDRVAGTEWEQAANATGVEFGISREEIDGVIVFDLDPAPSPLPPGR